jgi:regulator of nonsense transcripts 2
MMAESLESRKNERKPQFDVAIPIMTKNKDRDRDVPKQPENPGSDETSGPSTVAFSLLTKKGKTQQASLSSGC